MSEHKLRLSKHPIFSIFVLWALFITLWFLYGIIFLSIPIVYLLINCCTLALLFLIIIPYGTDLPKTEKSILMLWILYSVAQQIFFLDGFLIPLIPSVIPFISYLIIQFFSLALLWLIIVPLGTDLPKEHDSFNQYVRDIRLSKTKPITRNIFLGTCCALIILTCTMIATMLTGQYVFDINQILPPTSYMLLGSFTPGIWEEVCFRGAILTILLKKYPARKAIIISSAIFGFQHIFLPMSLLDVLTIMIKIYYAFFFGVFFAFLYLKTRSLLPCIIVHYLVDAFVALVIYAPGADIILHAVLVYLLGWSVVPCVVNVYLIKYIDKRWPIKE